MPGWVAASQLQGLFSSTSAPPPLPPNSPPGGGWSSGGVSPGMSFAADGSDSDSRQWAMALHFSVLLGFVFPFAGLIVPILIWQLKKSELPWLDIHGKHVANWIISKINYLFASGLLCIVFIGIPLLFALIICAV